MWSYTYRQPRQVHLTPEFWEVAAFCQISGCSPRVVQVVKSMAKNYRGTSLETAMQMLTSPDETEGQQALSIIGPLAENGKTWLRLHNVNDALSLPEDRIKVIPATMGSNFIYGKCKPKDDMKDVDVANGPCLYVLTATLSILEAATNGKITPYRLWALAIAKGRLQPWTRSNRFGLDDVDYGVIQQFWSKDLWAFGPLSRSDLAKLKTRQDPEVIAELLRFQGYWMWMRPDRFPIEAARTSRPFATFATVASESSGPYWIAKLPIELIHSIVVQMRLRDVVSLASTGKLMYNLLLGTQHSRDSLARTYIRTNMQWTLPYGKTELRWWNERNGHEALGWEYMRNCLVESHSMANRDRIWRICMSIEQAHEAAEWTRGETEDVSEEEEEEGDEDI